MVVRTEAGSLPNDAVVLSVFGGAHFADRNSLTDYLRLWKNYPRECGEKILYHNFNWITPANAGKIAHLR